MKLWAMMRVLLVSSVFLLLIGWGTRATWRSGDDSHALLRLSWRMRPERIERCRERTQAELDALPVHMRAPRVCETTVIPYRLVVTIDDARPDTTIILPAGARHDRPIYVLRDRQLAPGPHRVAVTFERTDARDDDHDDDDDDDDDGDDNVASVLSFDEQLQFVAGRVELITMTDHPRRLARLNSPR